MRFNYQKVSGGQQWPKSSDTVCSLQTFTHHILPYSYNISLHLYIKHKPPSPPPHIQINRFQTHFPLKEHFWSYTREQVDHVEHIYNNFNLDSFIKDLCGYVYVTYYICISLNELNININVTMKSVTKG